MRDDMPEPPAQSAARSHLDAWIDVMSKHGGKLFQVNPHRRQIAIITRQHGHKRYEVVNLDKYLPLPTA